MRYQKDKSDYCFSFTWADTNLQVFEEYLYLHNTSWAAGVSFGRKRKANVCLTVLPSFIMTGVISVQYSYETGLSTCWDRCIGVNMYINEDVLSPPELWLVSADWARLHLVNKSEKTDLGREEWTDFPCCYTKTKTLWTNATVWECDVGECIDSRKLPTHAKQVWVWIQFVVFPDGRNVSCSLLITLQNEIFSRASLASHTSMSVTFKCKHGHRDHIVN